MKVLDLFSGIGGFSLGLERAGMQTVAFCEIDPDCRKVLARHWPGVPIAHDITKREFTEGEADVICGGFPCQDISGAGRRAGASGARSGLFREMVRAIRVVRPKFALLENVADLLHRGMGAVLGELAEGGHDAEWDCVPAVAVGAPHERDRVWIIAYPNEWLSAVRRSRAVRRRGEGEGEGEAIGPAADADRQRQQQPGWMFRKIGRRPFYGGTGSDEWRTHWLDRLGAFRRMDDGVSRRLVEARPVGNAVLPQIPELFGRAILEAAP